MVGDRTGPPRAAIPAASPLPAFSSPLTVGSVSSLKIKRQIVHFSCNYRLKRPSGEKEDRERKEERQKERKKHILKQVISITHSAALARSLSGPGEG